MANQLNHDLIVAVTENLPVPAFVTDVRGYGSFGNRAMRDYLGTGSARLLPDHWDRILHPDDRGRAHSDWRQALSSGESYEAEYRYRRADGVYRWHLCRGKPLPGPDAAPVAWVTTCSDVEAQHRADRQKRTVLATLAHELRNPMASLQSGLDLLGAADLQPGPAETRAMMQRQLRQLAQITDILLDTPDPLEPARAQPPALATADQPPSGPVNLNEVVDAALVAIARLSGGREIELHRHQPDIAVEGIRIPMIQSIVAILDTCLQATAADQTVRVCTGTDGMDAIVGLRIHGPAAEPDLACRVLRRIAPTNQAPPTRHDAVSRLTLPNPSLPGLPRGSLTATRRGSGAELLLRLPLRPRDAAHRGGPEARPSEATTAPDTAAPAGRSRSVLIVDDHADTADALGTLLRLDGHTVTVAHEGRTALDALRTFPAQVVLLDLAMPGMDGYELARRIRRSCLGQRVHLIAISGWGQERDRERARQAGIDAHVTKPVDMRRLRRMLDALAE